MGTGASSSMETTCSTAWGHVSRCPSGVAPSHRRARAQLLSPLCLLAAPPTPPPAPPFAERNPGRPAVMGFGRIRRRCLRCRTRCCLPGLGVLGGSHLVDEEGPLPRDLPPDVVPPA